MQKLLKSNKKYFLCVLVIIGVGILAGFIYYNLLINDVKLNIIDTLKNYPKFTYNAILKDLIFMSIIIVLSFIIIGMPLGIFYLFYESLAMGFIMQIFLVTFKFKGFLFALLYLIINKLIPLILIIFFLRKIINISRYVIGLLIYKNDVNIKNKIFLNFKNSLYILTITLVINIILYFVSPVFTGWLTFLLK